MKRIFVVVILSMFVLACSQQAEKAETLGEKITLTEQTDIAAILANPDGFVGKKVLVSGEVVDVCKMKGCWIEIVGSNQDKKIKVKVEDDVIIFPQTAKGKTALVEGEVELLDMTKEELFQKQSEASYVIQKSRFLAYRGFKLPSSTRTVG